MDRTNQVVVMYFLTHMGLIFFMFPADILASMSVGHWLPVTAGFVLQLAILSIYTKGLACFEPNQNLVDIFLTAGRPAAFLLLLPMAAYLLMVGIITVRAYSEMITIVFLSNTPLWAIMALLLVIPAYIAMTGIAAIFRTCILLAWLFIPLVSFVMLTCFQNVDWHYLFPAIPNRQSFVSGHAFLQSLFAFTGSFVFLGFVRSQLPFKHRRLILWSFLLLPLYLLSAYIPLLTFGRDTATLMQFPFIFAVDTIDINWLLFDRVTIFFLLSMITFIMLFSSLVMWEIVQLMHRSLPKVHANVIIAGLAGLIFIVSLLVPNWKNVEQLLSWNAYLRLYTIAVIPAATFILGLRFRHRKTAAGL